MRARLAFVLLVPSLALAANYEVPLADVDDENDILALEDRGDISSATADTLIELLQEGVELNSASRDELYDLPGLSYADCDAILAYRKSKGTIEDPIELVGAGAITEAQLLVIVPFIRLEAGRIRLPVSAKFRSITAMSNGDFLSPGGVTPPPSILVGRAKFPFDLSAGFMLDTTRRQPGSPYANPFDETSLMVDDFKYRLGIPSLFAMWKTGQVKIVAGTFTIGFAERLTIDNTHRYTPNGIYLTDYYRRPIDASRICRLSSPDPINGVCGGGEKNTYITPDFQIRPNFRGLAGSIEDLDLGEGRKMDLYGFASYQTRDLYQYELYDKAVCDDPRDSSNPACSAPMVWLKNGSDIPTTRLIFTTLPYLYEELLAGAHADFKPTPQYRIGLTGYGATKFMHGGPLKLDTQEWSHVPFGGPWGAIGIDGRALFGNLAFFIEGTRSFDSIPKAPDSVVPVPPPGGGGFGVEQRTVYSPRGHELELSLRYYDLQFTNPYARPVSAPDEFDGQRARNEAGARVKYVGKMPYDFTLITRADFWVLPFTNPKEGPAGLANLYSLIRVDYDGYRAVTPSIWFDMRNRNLASSQHGTCSSETIVLTEGDSTFACSGDLYRLAARVDARPFGRLLSGAVQGWVTWKDDIRYKDRFRQDVMVWGELRSNPFDSLLLHLRSRYLYQDISDNTYLEQSLLTFLQATYTVNRNFRFSLRYDVLVYLDKRDLTLTRVPNPEHRFFLDLTAGF